MSKLKNLFMDLEDEGSQIADGAVEVYADSIRQALDLASRELGVDVTMLDYEVLEKGTRGLFGVGRQPYRVLVTPLATRKEHGDLDELESKLSRDQVPGITDKEKKDADGSFKVRVTKNGIMLTVEPPRGRGKPIDLNDVSNKLYSMRITNVDNVKLQKEVKKASGKPVKIGDWIPNPDLDGSMNLEVSEDEMKAFVHFVPPRYSGRHIEYDEIITALKGAGVTTGVRSEEIKEYLERMDYTRPLLAAEGEKVKNGKDAYVDYKVRVDSAGVSFEEDESGKVDFRNLELLENVVVGQILAIKVPAEEGVPGRTVTNRIMPARPGKDVRIQHGKGTILSEDGMELTAEINGQVVFKGGKVSIEPVYFVNGDVSLETGNIVFLGSVIISGSVQDNFEVKAAGNIEVKGNVQKAFLEAEGDIVIYQGITGREEARIESTGGSVYAKFIQSANVVAETDVIVPEGVLHSNIDAGSRICSNGKRARIVGGVIRAGDEVNVRFLGTDVSTKTVIRVGINPKILQQITDLEETQEKLTEEESQLTLNLKTLENQKRSQGKLPKDKEKLLTELKARGGKITERLEEIKVELAELKEYVTMLEHKGKICAENYAYPGVEVYIKDKKFSLKDPYKSVKFTLEGDQIRIGEYEPPENVDGKVFVTLRRRNR